MKKIKKYKLIIIIGLVIIGFGFYWVSIRPVQVKKDCAWTTEVIPADAGITKEQAEINKKSFIQKCDINKSYSTGIFNEFCLEKSQTDNINCLCNILIYNSTERDPQPIKEVPKEASENEYKSCLRQHGL